MPNNPNAVANLKPFKKGDARINRGGRPKSFDQLRKMAVKMMNEEITSRDGTVSMTRLEMILRDWLNSGNFQKQLAAMQYAYGKVPDKQELTGAEGEKLKIHVTVDGE